MISRTFVIFDVGEINKIDFSQVLETSFQTLRLNLDGTRTFVKWEGDIVPSCVESLNTKTEYYSLEEMVVILKNSEWFDISSYNLI
jgi:hypothetical protein